MGVDCLFFLVISTRSFDYVNHILSARSPRSCSRAIAHNFHPRSMIGVSFLESSWRDVILNLETSKLLLLIFFSLLGTLFIDSSFCSKEEKTRCVFLFERKRRLDFDFPSMFFFIHCYYWGWEKWGHRSTYFHIHYFSLFSKCSDNKSMR